MPPLTYKKNNMKTIVSYGGGTNSTAMLVGLFERGQRPDAITFADTGGEKPGTYTHITSVNEWCRKVGFPLIEILRGAMPQQVLDGSLEGECLRLGKLPAKAYGFSSCSDKWKMEPQRRYNRSFAASHGIDQSDIVRLIGFDADEHSRVERGKSMAHKKLCREEYPLYDWGWGREDCVDAIARAGLKQPGKSACFFCPSSKKPEILALRAEHPDLLLRALEMERIALAGEGPAPRTTSKGLGRGFGWAAFLAQVDALTESASEDQREKLFASTMVPEIDCGCYDG